VYGLSLEEVAARSRAVLDEVGRAVVGKRAALRVILLALLADGHVLIEDAPGLAKTLTARSFAAVTGLGYGRVQFTPDLLPADITGSEIFDQRTQAFEFRRGPVFTQVLLADEVNRAPPRTQAALLEAMQERQVTSDGQTRRLPRPFLVIATQNPLEFEGTYPLPEAQLDRFLVRCRLGYPTADEEWEVLRRRLERRAEQTHLDTVIDSESLLAMQAAIEQVHVAESIGRYIVDLVAASRAHARVQVGASPRGALALLALARAAAALEGRDYVIPEDVKAVAIPALAHRLALRPEAWVRRVRGEDVIEECLASTPAPPTPEPA
jgi:MoxR-like ATPase